MIDVLKQKPRADPTGATPSDAAFAAAIKKAVTNGNAKGRTGEVIRVPAGTYRLDADLDLLGSVKLEGESGGGTRLLLAAGKCIYLHSAASAPYSFRSGGPHLVGIEIYAGRPTFGTWVSGGANSVGKCIRVEGDNRWHLECVVAGASGTDKPELPGLTEMPLPDLAYAWTPANSVVQNAVRRATNGRRDVVFIAQNGGTTGAREPTSWNFGIGSTTIDGNVEWVAAKSNFVFDGTTVWRLRWHSVVLFNGTIRDFQISGFANFGVAIYGDVHKRPRLCGNPAARSFGV